MARRRLPEAEVLEGALRRARDGPELTDDPRFADFAARDVNRATLEPILEEAFLARTRDEWLAVLTAAGVPASPVNSVAEALDDPQAAAREAVVEIDHPRFGTVREVATPLRVGEERKPLRRAPFRGEHTEEVLIQLCGYGPERIAELRVQGVFGDVPVTT